MEELNITQGVHSLQTLALLSCCISLILAFIVDSFAYPLFLTDWGVSFVSIYFLFHRINVRRSQEQLKALSKDQLEEY